jgi:proteasome accessory factor A
VGVTRLVLDLIEAGEIPQGVEIADPIRVLRKISRDESCRWIVTRVDGSTLSAIDLQRVYLLAARRCFAGRDGETDWLLREWGYVLDQLERDPMTLANRLDWVAKKQLLEDFAASEGVAWDAEVMFSLDLEYHNIARDSGLYYALENQGQMQRVVTEEAIAAAITTPPATTRAYGRGRLIRHLLRKGHRRYVVDWDLVAVDDERFLRLRNPFHNYRAEIERLKQRM